MGREARRVCPLGVGAGWGRTNADSVQQVLIDLAGFPVVKKVPAPLGEGKAAVAAATPG